MPEKFFYIALSEEAGRENTRFERAERKAARENDRSTCGRPEKKPEDRRTNILRIRLTDGERRILDAKAKKRGKDTSTAARKHLVEEWQ